MMTFVYLQLKAKILALPLNGKINYAVFLELARTQGQRPTAGPTEKNYQRKPQA